jgi:hypothetical protein
VRFTPSQPLPTWAANAPFAAQPVQTPTEPYLWPFSKVPTVANRETPVRYVKGERS